MGDFAIGSRARPESDGFRRRVNIEYHVTASFSAAAAA
jgi:hypothetical protein